MKKTVLFIALLWATPTMSDTFVSSTETPGWDECCERGYQEFLRDDEPYGAFGFECHSAGKTCSWSSSISNEDSQIRDISHRLEEKYESRIVELEKQVLTLRRTLACENDSAAIQIVGFTLVQDDELGCLVWKRVE